MFEWNDSLRTGVEEIDSQHKKLFEKSNSYFSAQQSGINDQIIVDTLNYMVEYAKLHFVTEENHMELSDYDGLTSHRDDHKRLVAHLVDIYKTLISRKNPEELVNSLNSFIQDWFVTHIFQHDKRMADFLKKRKAELV